MSITKYSNIVTMSINWLSTYHLPPFLRESKTYIQSSFEEPHNFSGRSHHNLGVLMDTNTKPHFIAATKVYHHAKVTRISITYIFA